MAQRPGPKNINWAGERDLYATGDESLRAVAARLGVAKSAVERVACDRDNGANHGRTWSEWRADFRESVSGETLEAAKKVQAAQAVSVTAKQRAAIAQLLDKAIPLALAALDSDALEAKDRVKLALSAMAMQRRIHGLDRVAALEVTGKDGEPIDIALQLDPVGDASLRSVLEAALGREAQSG